MGILGKAEVTLPILRPLDQGVSDVVPNAASQVLENVVQLKSGELDRRPGFETVVSSFSYPPGHGPGFRVDLLDEETVLTNNRVYKRSGGSLNFKHDFFKTKIDRISQVPIVNYTPYAFDTSSAFGANYCLLLATAAEKVSGMDLVAVRTFSSIGSTPTKLEFKDFYPTLSAYTNSIQSYKFPIIANAINTDQCEVIYLSSGNIFKRTITFSTSSISAPVLFKGGGNNKHIQKVWYSGAWHLAILEETTASTHSLILSAMASYSAISAASVFGLAGAVIAGEIADVLVRPATNTITYLITYTSTITFVMNRRAITKQFSSPTPTVVTLEQIFSSSALPDGFFDEVRRATGAVRRLDQQIYSHGHLILDQLGVTVVDFNRVQPYVTYTRLDSTGNIIDQQFKFNGAHSTSGQSRFIHEATNLCLALNHINECYINEDETAEENYRTYYLCSFNRVDANGDAILLDKVDEFDAMFVRGSNKVILQGPSSDMHGVFVTFASRQYSDDKGASEFVINFNSLQAGDAVEIRSKLYSNGVTLFTTGGLPFSCTKDGIGRPFSVFPSFKPRVLVQRESGHYHSGATSNTQRPLGKYGASLSSNKVRFYIFPHGNNIDGFALLPILVYNSSSWVSYTAKLYHTTPPGGPGINVKINPFDDALTVGFKIISEFVNAGVPIAQFFYPLGDGEFFHGDLHPSTPDNTTHTWVYCGARYAAIYEWGGSPKTIQWVTQKQYLNNNRRSFGAPSPVVTKTIRSNSYLSVSIVDPGFSNLSFENERVHVFQTQMNGSQFYLAAAQSYYVEVLLNIATGRIRSFYHGLSVEDQMRACLSPHIVTENSKLNLNQLAPWTGGIVQDGPMPANVIDFFKFKNRIGLILASGVARFSRPVIREEDLPIFPLELELNSQSFNDKIIGAVGLEDKLLVQTQRTLYAIAGDTLNDTLTTGGFSEPRKL
ncbi:MAG: hypothetical protein QXP01_06185, partial [Candidatus Hadarchaeum sp.]